MSPKIFLSHASEDKERFVNDFASKLMQNGIDVWLDKWEMMPSDSLIDKIFEEGLKQADAVIIVISKYSITKPWVKEELNTAMVNKINKGTRLIPVVIDSCEVPESIKSTLWEPIKDLASYQKNFERIVAAIFSKSLKPKIGHAPAYIHSVIHKISYLEDIDNLVLKQACESLNDYPYDPISPEKVYSSDKSPPKDKVLECLEILSDLGYVTLSHYIGSGGERWGCNFRITEYGFEEYCKAYIENYTEIQSAIAATIVNNGATSSFDLTDKLKIPVIMTTHALTVLESNQFIKLSKTIGGRVAVYDVSHKLKRALQNA